MVVGLDQSGCLSGGVSVSHSRSSWAVAAADQIVVDRGVQDACPCEPCGTGIVVTLSVRCSTKAGAVEGRTTAAVAVAGGEPRRDLLDIELPFGGGHDQLEGCVIVEVHVAVEHRFTA